MRKKREPNRETDLINADFFKQNISQLNIAEQLRVFASIESYDIQMDLLESIPPKNRYMFIPRIRSTSAIVTLLNELPDEETKRITFNYVAKQFKGNNIGLLEILSGIDFDVTLPQNMLLFKLNNLNTFTLDLLINIQKHVTNYQEMKFKINEHQGDSKKIEYSFQEM